MKNPFSIYSKIARTVFLNVRPVLQPNFIFDIGIRHQRTSSMINPKIYNVEQASPVVTGEPTSSYDGVGGRGEIYVPKTSDNYIGGGIGEY